MRLSVNPRPFSTIAVMKRGGRFETARGRWRCAAAGLSYPPTRNTYPTGTEDEILYFAIHFNFSDRHAEYSPQRYLLQTIDGLSTDLFLSRLESIREYVSASGAGRMKAYGAFLDLYADVIPLLTPDRAQNTALQSVKNVIDYIERNSDQEFTVGHLAQMCHLSESRIYTLFHQATGRSPIGYRNSVRIRRAMTLLGEPYTIDEISMKVGFSSSAYFRRVFKNNGKAALRIQGEPVVCR